MPYWRPRKHTGLEDGKSIGHGTGCCCCGGKELVVGKSPGDAPIGSSTVGKAEEGKGIS